MREILGSAGVSGGGGAADCESCSVAVASHRKDGLEVREKLEGRDRERKTPVQRLAIILN